MVPVVFSALAMNSVGKAAMDMVNEVRRQLREIPGIMEGTGTPDYGRCVEISTKAALREMLLPGIITIVSPIIIGMVMGPEALGAYMAGVTVSGVLWAIFQNNAGGAWDNAKKSFEKGVEIEVNGKKEIFYKKSEPHKAAVVGDTVGDPFKDTSGPSMNILIKLSSLVGLTIAPLIAINDGGHGSQMMDDCCDGKAKMECHESMGSGCEMDAEGNCVIDSTTCAQWMSEGKCDSSDCVKMENGKCHIKAAACEKMGGCSNSDKGSGCEESCMEKCKKAGIECGNGKPCPMHKASAMHNCNSGCDQDCIEACKSTGKNCEGKSDGCCKS
jgi:K(+)-stimulated pyrophosphate-energized sodium pump